MDNAIIEVNRTPSGKRDLWDEAIYNLENSKLGDGLRKLRNEIESLTASINTKEYGDVITLRHFINMDYMFEHWDKEDFAVFTERNIEIYKNDISVKINGIKVNPSDNSSKILCQIVVIFGVDSANDFLGQFVMRPNVTRTQRVYELTIKHHNKYIDAICDKITDLKYYADIKFDGWVWNMEIISGEPKTANDVDMRSVWHYKFGEVNRCYDELGIDEDEIE